MKTPTETNEDKLTFSVVTDCGERLSQLDCPSAVTCEIERAVQHNRHCGSVYSGGVRHDWQLVEPDDIVIQLTREDLVVEEISIPKTAWDAFCLCADRRRISAREWLATILAKACSDEIEIRDMLTWLFPRKPNSDEIARFEAAHHRFHADSVVDHWLISRS